MSKKKNARRKKSNNLLKGMAAAGAVVGGGTFIVGNNTVYAAETDLDSTVAGSESQSELKTSESVSQSLTPAQQDSNDVASASSIVESTPVTQVSSDDTSGKIEDGQVLDGYATTFALEGERTVDDGSQLPEEQHDSEYESIMASVHKSTSLSDSA